MYITYSEIITDVIIEAEELGKTHGFYLTITGGSQQSCSSYFSLRRSREAGDDEQDQCLTVRISDHSARKTRGPVDFQVGLNSDHGTTRIEVHKVYESLVCVVDDDGEVIDSHYVVCDADDDNAELMGFNVSREEVKRVAQSVIEAALASEWE